MKMYDEINYYKKEYVFEQYTRIVEKYKDYKKITKVQMLKEIYDVYSDYNNIIDICTTRELKYLKMILDNDKVKSKELKINFLDIKYDWERESLRNKFLIDHHYYENIKIFEEIIDVVKDSIKNVNFKEKKKIDDLNEIIVSYCKVQGSA
ncbi:MAG: hypothetical protein RR984_02475, partial [Bacilli bacterium]